MWNAGKETVQIVCTFVVSAFTDGLCIVETLRCVMMERMKKANSMS